MTLLLSHSDVERALDLDEAMETLRSGFTRDGETSGTIGTRVRTDLPGPGMATALLPGVLPGVSAYSVKVNAKFPAARPALRGVVCLHSLQDGELLAVADSATVTAWRTGLAAAVATDLLSRMDAGTVGIVGAGAQASMTLHGLDRLRSIDEVVVYDLNPARAEAFALEHRHPGRHVHAAGSAGAVAQATEIVVLATWSTTPLLGLTDVHAGHHLTSLGANEPGKQELDADLLGASTWVVDDLDLVATSGALGSSGLDRSAVQGTLGQVLRGEHPGRCSEEEITLYTPVGLPWQDLALTWHAYRRAEELGLGHRVDFLD